MIDELLHYPDPVALEIFRLAALLFVQAVDHVSQPFGQSFLILEFNRLVRDVRLLDVGFGEHEPADSVVKLHHFAFVARFDFLRVNGEF